MRGQDFDGDVAIELGIGGAADGAHAAFAELAADAVVGDGQWAMDACRVNGGIIQCGRTALALVCRPGGLH